MPETLPGRFQASNFRLMRTSQAPGDDFCLFLPTLGEESQDKASDFIVTTKWMGYYSGWIHFPYLLRFGRERLGSESPARAGNGAIRSRTINLVAHNFSHTTCGAINPNYWSQESCFAFLIYRLCPCPAFNIFVFVTTRFLLIIQPVWFPSWDINGSSLPSSGLEDNTHAILCYEARIILI